MLQRSVTHVGDCRDAEAQSNKALRKLTQVQLAVTEICGRARNSYSKGVLKKDFRDGLLEMEETVADVEADAGGKLSAAYVPAKQEHCFWRGVTYVSCSLSGSL